MGVPASEKTCSLSTSVGTNLLAYNKSIIVALYSPKVEFFMSLKFLKHYFFQELLGTTWKFEILILLWSKLLLFVLLSINTIGGARW